MDSNPAGSLAEAFRKAALRPTAQRYAVLEFLAARPVHATAEEIYHAVNRLDPRASRATVYNNLKSLMRSGLVREVVSEARAARFDANLRPHHHFVCDRCGTVEDISWFDVAETPAMSPLEGRTVRTFDLVFRGVCRVCGHSNPKPGERT